MHSWQKNPKRKIKCYAGTHSFFLDPYGDIFPCIMLNKKIGNIKEGFDKVWLSKEEAINLLRPFFFLKSAGSVKFYPPLIKKVKLLDLFYRLLYDKCNLCLPGERVFARSNLGRYLTFVFQKK